MNLLKRRSWMLWALVPVAVIAFHFGPGQGLAAREVAANRFDEAMALEQHAVVAQQVAYETHLSAIDVRRRVFLDTNIDPEASEELAVALEAERVAYTEAGDRWEEAANAYENVQEQLADADPETLRGVRWSKARARVRSGAIWDGVTELESLLDEVEADDNSTAAADLARSAREELAVACYFGARLLRESGEPALQWRTQASRARQHFRYLAESAAKTGANDATVRGLEDNVERAIELEQMDLSELEARPLPKESPKMARGSKPSNCSKCEKISQKPPKKKDGRGAGGAGPIGPGW